MVDGRVVSSAEVTSELGDVTGNGGNDTLSDGGGDNDLLIGDGGNDIITKPTGFANRLVGDHYVAHFGRPNLDLAGARYHGRCPRCGTAAGAHW